MEVSDSYAQALDVCLAKHHEAPMTEFDVGVAPGSRYAKAQVRWAAPGANAVRAWGNSDDATRDAAYILALAAVDHFAGMVAIARTEVRSGADYFIAPAGDELPTDLETATRLEVSGVNAGGRAEVRRRVKGKIEQARNGNLDTPAKVCVVAFKQSVIEIADAP